MASVTGKDVMGIRVIVIGVIFSVLAIAAVGGRVWARRLRKTELQLSDFLALIALAFTLALNATIITAAIMGGAGQHMISTSLTEDIILAKCFLAAGVLWALAIACIKLSLLAFYISIFRTRIFVASAYVFAVLSVSLMLAVTLATMLICRPLSYNWDKNEKGTCGRTTALYLGGGIANLLLDVSMVVLPMPMLWRLQMKMSRKFTLTLIFGLGAFVCIVSILRVVAIHKLSTVDLSYTSVSDGVWSILEPSLGIVASCLPIMQPVLSRRSLRASSRPLLDQDERPLTKRTPEDRMYPLSNLAETINEVETDIQPFDVEASTWRIGQKVYDDEHMIKVERGYDVQSKVKV
ncbi:MAG: hypothetical protein Q9161_009779 [Pseudevernia consocians]